MVADQMHSDQKIRTNNTASDQTLQRGATMSGIGAGSAGDREREDRILAVHPAPRGTTYPRPSSPRPGPRWGGYTAFVLSGGGARGALEVGALRALLEAGEYPDVVVGTSIGSWNGAWLAMDPTLESIEYLAEVWRGITASQIMIGRDLPSNYPPQAFAGMLLLNAARRVMRGQTSLYGNEGIRKLLSRHLGGLCFEDLKLPFRVVATNLTEGTRAVLSKGELVPALMASSSIPGIFPPISIDNALYCDGGMLDTCSLETAVKMGARRLFLLAIGHDVESDGGDLWRFESEDSVPSQRMPAANLKLAGVLERSAQVLGRYQLERGLENLPKGIETHVICLSSGDGGGMLDFHDLPGWIERGYETTRTYLQGMTQQRPELAATQPITTRREHDDEVVRVTPAEERRRPYNITAIPALPARDVMADELEETGS